jgi:hypothetical protein
MKRFLFLGLLLIVYMVSSVYAGDIKVINAKSGFPEGPLWYRFVK